MFRTIAVVILLLFCTVAAGQPPTYEKQRQAIMARLNWLGINAGTRFEIAGETYVIKEINVTFTRLGSPTIEIKSEVVR